MGDITTDKQNWLEAREKLLAAEKAHARATAELAAQRRAMPKLPVAKEYRFASTGGEVGLIDLFAGRSQLIVQHVMFGPDADLACPMCSFWLDGVNPMTTHMNQRDVSFVAVSRAPVAALQAYRERMNWHFDWVSAGDGDFNRDFHVSPSAADLEAGETYYNYRQTPATMSDMHGVSVFERDATGQIFHTYSTYARGLEAMNACYAYLDLTPKGRNEDDLPFSMAWVRRRDEYPAM